MIAQQHDFGRRWAPQRKRVYIASAITGIFFCSVVPALMVGLGIWPMQPTGHLAAAAVCVPIIVPIVLAWWDAPGENRTTLEKANEFMIVWFPITASSQIFWEIPWLVGDALGKMNLTEHDHWGWIWWFYGAADTRYLTSNPGLFGMETVAVIGGIIMITQWWRLLTTARHDDAKRINALWWSFFAMSVMLAVLTIYYVSETRAHFVDIKLGFWGFALEFTFMNIPWLIAPAISLPFCAKQLAYLYRKQALAAAPSTTGAKLADTSV